MELLDQPAYSGPPPRYTPGQTVYYRGLAYTVAAVGGRAPLVGWTYEIDGPGELLRVGEGEISDQERVSAAQLVGAAIQPILMQGLGQVIICVDEVSQVDAATWAQWTAVLDRHATVTGFITSRLNRAARRSKHPRWTPPGK